MYVGAYNIVVSDKLVDIHRTCVMINQLITTFICLYIKSCVL